MFSEDVKKGTAIEDLFISILTRKFPGHGIAKSVVGDKYFDIAVAFPRYKLTYEVKADFLAERTGNLAIEYRYKLAPSGISVSTANYWVDYVAGKDSGEFYVFNTHDLREELKLNWAFYQKVEGGDDKNSHLVLIPLARARNFHFLDVFPA